MKKTAIIVSVIILAGLNLPSFAQYNVGRTLKTNDTCQCLAASFQLNNMASFYNKWMLLDAFDCIDKEWLFLNPGITWLSIPRHLRPDTALTELTPTSDVFAQGNVSGGV